MVGCGGDTSSDVVVTGLNVCRMTSWAGNRDNDSTTTYGIQHARTVRQTVREQNDT